MFFLFAGQIDFGQEASASRKKEHTFLKKETEKQGKTFEVLIREKLRYKPKKCYGCGKMLLDAQLVLKTQDVREYYGSCRTKHLAFQESNVYFHLLEKCVGKKYGSFAQHNFTVPDAVMVCLTSTQITMLKDMNIIQDAGDTEPQDKMGEVAFGQSKPAQCEEAEEIKIPPVLNPRPASHVSK
ncbi:hypothetical protein scyTo_0023472 [Scyliorhinus torazame]|uniref:Uncharacterized protein n=1 Tax=Scyliorhinus torazame TaxID=75743 RepID=A0A401QDE1_SCYTO|nr:hypothetical protein [Scyliorhinus torazame]